MSDEGTVTVPLKTDPTLVDTDKRKPLAENHIGTGVPPVSDLLTEDGHRHGRKPLTNHIGTGTPAVGTDSDETGEEPPPPPPPAPDNHIGTGTPPPDAPESSK
jgi:hypothetical protein